MLVLIKNIGVCCNIIVTSFGCRSWCRSWCRFLLFLSKSKANSSLFNSKASFSISSSFKWAPWPANFFDHFSPLSYFISSPFIYSSPISSILKLNCVQAILATLLVPIHTFYWRDFTFFSNTTIAKLTLRCTCRGISNLLTFNWGKVNYQPQPKYQTIHTKIKNST